MIVYFFYTFQTDLPGRKAAGLTQEETARQVGLTRQAISSYESGRTQPDLDMLVRLAQVYGTDISCILYGKNASRKEAQEPPRRRRIVMITALSAMAVLFLLTLADSIVLLITNLHYQIPNGIVPDALRAASDKRISMLKLWTLLQQLVLVLSPLLFFLLVCLLAATVPFLFFDPLYGFFDYISIPMIVFPKSILLLIYSLILGAIKNRAAKRRSASFPMK